MSNSKWRGISSLKVAWRRDSLLDSAIKDDKKYRICSRIVREVVSQPNQCFPVRYLENRREGLGLTSIHFKTFLTRYPTLFEIYNDRIVKPITPSRPANTTNNSQAVPFVRPSKCLIKFLNEDRRIRSENQELIVAKLCKILMMSKDKAIKIEKLENVKREFGFPDDFMTSVVPSYPHYFRQSSSFLELASWNHDFGKSVIELRSEEEEKLTGIRMRPNFEYNLPSGCFLRMEMREWVRDWLELPYISPYSDTSLLEPGSVEMEKRMVAVLHEFLSLVMLRRAPIPSVGKFKEEYLLSNEFGNAFSRHPGIFYVSLKGGIKTAVLREAYRDGALVDREPLLEINDKFVEIVEEGHQRWLEQMKIKAEAHRNKEKEMMLSNSKLQTINNDIITDQL